MADFASTRVRAGNANITIEGGVGVGAGGPAAGARLTFAGGSFWPTTLANSTIIVNGGHDGAQGGNVLFFGGVRGGTAQLVANAGGTFDFGDQRFFGGTEVGSIEGDGTFVLNGSLLTTGNQNRDTIVSGSIANGNTAGAMLTKVGTGTLTLAGTNTYSGLTTVAGGTLRVDGSIAGDVLVRSGARLEGRGHIPRMPTVEAGGVFAPGTSPGTITIGGLTMMSGSTLEFELGDVARDRIVVTNNGNVSLAGTLAISLLDGFTPTLGQSFSLFEGAIGSITGAFDSIIAPTFNGLTFDVVQNAGSVLLQVGEATLLPGDFNGNGAIDAADYVVWRKTNGAPAGYDTWRSNFGRTAGSGAALPSAEPLSAAVPEPATLAMFVIAMIAMLSHQRAIVS